MPRSLTQAEASVISPRTETLKLAASGFKVSLIMFFVTAFPVSGGQCAEAKPLRL